MEFQASNISAQLQGDWTINGVVRQIDPLMELSRGWDRTSAVVDIDCSGIAGIDLCGFQLLYTWLHCLDIRGVKPKLVNVPELVQQSQNRLGLSELFDTPECC
jgi:ABC-type transporter Mla MlaB component